MVQTAKLLGAAFGILALFCTPLLGAAPACSSCSSHTVTAPSSVAAGGCLLVTATSSDFELEVRITDAEGRVLFDSSKSNASNTVNADICLDSDVVGPLTIDVSDTGGNNSQHSVAVD